MSESRRRKPNAAYVRKDAARWRHEGWTSTPNSVTRDPDIPPDECWAWTWLASHDDDFEVSGKALYEAKAALGRNRAYELLSNLERRGLLLRRHAYDEVERVPYVQYDLQPRPVPEEERTWEPPRAKPRRRGPHPGAKAARAEPVDNPVSPGHDGFPTGRESPPTSTFPTGREDGVPDRAGIPPDQHFPDRAGSRVDSRQGGSRQGGNPYKEEKISEEERERGKEGPLRAPTAIPTVEAQELLKGLIYGRHRAPRQAELLELAGLVDAAVTQGLTLTEVKRYAQSVVNGATTSAVGYLTGGLQPDMLPVPLRRPDAFAPPRQDVAAPVSPEESPGWQAARAQKFGSSRPAARATSDGRTAEPAQASAMFEKALSEMMGGKRMATRNGAVGGGAG